MRPTWLLFWSALLVASCQLSTAGELVTPQALGEPSGSSSGGGSGSSGGAGDDEVDATSDDSGGGLLFLGDGGEDASDDAGGGFATQGPPPTHNCNFSGVWASRLTIDVSWAPMGLNLQAFILAPGSGTIKQWILGTRTAQGTSLSDATVVCGIALPDFKGTAVVGGATFGVIFPNSLFDNAYLPTFVVNGTVSGFAAGAMYSTSPVAALVGLTMTNPTTDPWPTTVTTPTDPDQDGKPGVTANESTGGSYSLIPVGIPSAFAPIVYSQKLYVALRQVTQVAGSVTDCDHISGTVTIPEIGGQYAINSHVLGCELADGGDCSTSGSSSQAAFVDNTEPVFTPSGATTFTSVKVPTGTDCATVRTMLQ